MAAMILLTIFCVGSIVFLICFFVALGRDRKRPYHALQVCREASLDIRPAGETASEGVSSAAA